MTAKFFIVSNTKGEVSYKPAAEAIAHNVDAFLSFDTPLPDTVLAQADDEAQAERFVQLLRGAKAL